MWNDREGPETFDLRKRSAARLRNENYPQSTISYCRWLWSVIEPEKGKFRWDIIDGALASAETRGQALQVRVQPYIGEDTPEWYWDLGGRRLRTGGTESHHIDHNNPAYLKHWGEFLNAFGRRYDGHPVLESFDVAYGGPCGECGGNANDDNAEALIDLYLRSFRKTQLVSMLGTHGCTYAATSGLGWRADCYGDLRANGQGEVPDHLCWNHMLDQYPKEIEINEVKDAWKTAPVTLESCWTVGHWFNQGWDIDWILEQGLMYHASVFMPKSSAIPEEWAEKIDDFDRVLGYRFAVRQITLPLEARPGQRIQADWFVDNVGVAPIYRPYKLAYRFRQGKEEHVVVSSQDIREWMPGHNWFSDRITFPKGIRTGVVKIDVGIVEPKGRQPRVRFAVKESRKDGWHPMTCIDAI
ncbi:MAG: DUF4832 domain-containing protein, partial [Planctomycetota bacterium]|nr:DUF4832 domain-containing protein [Planctomycetota bacterium]